MIEILRPTPEKLEIFNKFTTNCWVNVVSPTDAEIEKIKTLLDVPKEVLLSLKDIDEIPEIEYYDKCAFITIKTPYNNPKVDLEYYTLPIGIFATNEFVVTVSFFESEVIANLKKQKFVFRKTQLVYRLLLDSARLYLEYLKEISKKMYVIESKLAESQKNEVVMQFLELEKSLVFFSTSLKSNKILLERIAKEGSAKEGVAKYGIQIKTQEDRKFIGKAIDEHNQAIQMVNIYTNILSNTLDAFASIVSNNLNIVIKILASITIVLSLPTLISSVYGMNIPLPFQHSPHAFGIVMLISFALSFLSVLVLWKYKFF